MHAVVEEGEGGRGYVKKKKARKSMDGVARDDEAATEYKRKVSGTGTKGNRGRGELAILLLQPLPRL